MNTKYLKQLSYQYPTISTASSEIIRLSTKLNLPKGTEHFVSDIHGEFSSFQHVIRNASGSISYKIDQVFGDTLSQKEKNALGTLIYYPEEKIEMIEKNIPNFKAWCADTIKKLIDLTRVVSVKHSLQGINKFIQPEYQYVITELLIEKKEEQTKVDYYQGIIESIIKADAAKTYIIVLCHLIQKLAVDHLHVVGDIFDRGLDADKVMETIYNTPNIDIEWGNHDLQWMGAACGSLPCIAGVIRLAMRADNLQTLENAYGINLLPLVKFGMKAYAEDSCKPYATETKDHRYDPITSKAHKAIVIILLKLEGQLNEQYPEFGISNRIVLDKIDLKNKTVLVNGIPNELMDTYFPTIDWNDPFKLTKEEEEVMQELKHSFLTSEKLQRHIEFLFSHGGMYRVFNGNLLYHGCVPLNNDGTFKSVTVRGKEYKGKALFDVLETWIRRGRYSKNPAHKKIGEDYMYFMWSSPLSPLYGKQKMIISEHYFITDSTLKVERNNIYYELDEDETVVRRIFDDFGINFETGHIINGHVPVIKGQSPLHCNGKVIIIDGGFTTSLHNLTGKGGYTLISNSHELKLMSHRPFVSILEAINNEVDLQSKVDYRIPYAKRMYVRDTDNGKIMLDLIDDLKDLIIAYKEGIIREHPILDNFK